MGFKLKKLLKKLRKKLAKGVTFTTQNPYQRHLWFAFYPVFVSRSMVGDKHVWLKTVWRIKGVTYGWAYQEV